jgi:hypothetical protein
VDSPAVGHGRLAYYEMVMPCVARRTSNGCIVQRETNSNASACDLLLLLFSDRLRFADVCARITCTAEIRRCHILTNATVLVNCSVK